jgi:hypothetical protein
MRTVEDSGRMFAKNNNPPVGRNTVREAIMLEPPPLGCPLFVAGELQEFGWRQNQARIFPVQASIPITELRKGRQSAAVCCRGVNPFG